MSRKTTRSIAVDEDTYKALIKMSSYREPPYLVIKSLIKEHYKRTLPPRNKKGEFKEKRGNK